MSLGTSLENILTERKCLLGLLASVVRSIGFVLCLSLLFGEDHDRLTRRGWSLLETHNLLVVYPSGRLA